MCRGPLLLSLTLVMFVIAMLLRRTASTVPLHVDGSATPWNQSCQGRINCTFKLIADILVEDCER